MKLLRIFSNSSYKGTQNYINSQKKYTALRTALFFGISLSLFIVGWVNTGTRSNILTVVAILGCLPASKSAVNMIMYLRYKSCSPQAQEKITANIGHLTGLYDMVFTSYKKNYVVAHIVVAGKTICGYTEDENFLERDFNQHITDILKVDHFKDVTVKIFTDLSKYEERLQQMQELDQDSKVTLPIIDTLKSVSL